MTQLIKKLDLGEEEVSMIFLKAAEHDHKGLELPVMPKNAWQDLREKLFA